MERKMILFDLDGTITDSGPGIMNCARPTLAHFGITDVSEEDMRKFIGPPLQYSFDRLGVPKDQIDEAIRLYRSRYLECGMFDAYVYEGIEQLLQKLRNDGHRLFVATSKPEFMAQQILEHFGLSQYFERICGASTDSSRNKKDQVIEYLLSLCGNEQPIIMVGDTHFDVLGAAVFRIPTIGVTWGYGTRESMADVGAAAIVENMEQLYRKICQM